MKWSVQNTQAYFSAEAQTCLEDNGCEVTFRQWAEVPEEEELLCQAIQGVDAIIAGCEWYTRTVFEAADRLKIVARTGAGYDHIDLAAASDHGVWVTNTPDATSPAVADFTIGLILSLLRDVHKMAAEMKRGKWEKRRGREMGSATLGIVGTGSIGREVIKRARGFGSTVLAYDVQEDQDFASAWQVTYVPLADLVAQSDIVSLHVPLNPHTKGLIDERRIGLMKPGAYLVNTSRPAVIDRVALLDALRAGKIAGAALDVHDPAPTPPDDPLVGMDNVLATPWTAYNTEAAVARMSITAARDVLAVLQGRTPSHPLNQIPGQ